MSEEPWEHPSLCERLSWWAFRFYGKGERENMASDCMTEAHERIERLEAALREIASLSIICASDIAVAALRRTTLEGKKDD